MVQYLIVGNGVAGTTAAEQIRREDPDGRITIVTDEDLPFYWRIRLNEFISGDISEEALVSKSRGWYEEHDIRLILETSIRRGDAEAKALTSESGDVFPYDALLLATGSHAFVPPIEGSDKQGVFTLRSVADARAIAVYAAGVEEAILIGGGLLGLETGNALRRLGKKVTVVEFFPRLLPRQLDPKGAARLQRMMEGMGFSFVLGAKTREIRGEGSAEGVLLEGGEALTGGMVLISAGVRPNLELARDLGLKTDKGVQVDETLRTSRPGIFAAGDVAEFQGMPYGIWPAAMEQGKIAGVNMAGGDLTYEGTTPSNILKVAGIDLASAGEIDAEEEHDSRVLETEEVYKKVVFDNGRIIGCIMLGDTKGFNRITRAIQEKEDVSARRDGILAKWAS
ncbi:MAG: FAD-dependent oxidoreductase [Deltaproteobacteria bacterium]|nr:FAD-dependent oxidoreductase [Deltaproteobacteria bacterium]